MTPRWIKNNLGKKNYQHNVWEECSASVEFTAPIPCPEQQGREKPAVLSPAPLHAVASPGNAFQEQTMVRELSVSGRENILQMNNSPFSCKAWRHLILPIPLHKYGNTF